MSEKKYELVPSTRVTFGGKDLYRPKALKSFLCQGRKVEKGDIGGFIRSENSLSQEGTCWVFDEAIVCNHAKIMDDAKIENRASIKGRVEVSEKARVNGDAIIMQNARICGNSFVGEHVKIMEQAVISGDSIVMGETIIKSRTEVKGKSLIRKWSSLDAGHFYNPSSPKIIGMNIIDNSVIIGPVYLDINNNIKNSYISGNLRIRNSIIKNADIGLTSFNNLWDGFNKIKIEDAEIFSSEQILITPLKFVRNKDEEKVPFIWYKTKCINDFFNIIPNKSIMRNDIRHIFRSLRRERNKNANFEAIKNFILRKDTEITNIPAITIREILNKEGVNDPRIEASILLQDKIMYYILSYFLGMFLCFYRSDCEDEDEINEFLEDVIDDAEIDIKNNNIISINHIPIKEDDGVYLLIKREINRLKGSA